MNSNSITAEQLLSIPSIDSRYELIAGRVRTLPFCSWQRTQIVGNLAARLGSYVRQNTIGKLFAAGTGFLIRRGPDTVLAPDLAFVSRNRFSDDLPNEGYWPGAPDLAVEVLSPSDRLGEVDERISAWLTAGAQAVWVVDPNLQIVTIHQVGKRARVRSAGEVLEGDPVVPGFSCPVEDLFQ